MRRGTIPRAASTRNERVRQQRYRVISLTHGGRGTAAENSLPSRNENLVRVLLCGLAAYAGTWVVWRRSLAIQQADENVCDEILLEGKGHGIGLCQAGARAIAKRGASFQQILSHYYPNATIVSWSGQPKATTVRLL